VGTSDTILKHVAGGYQEKVWLDQYKEIVLVELNMNFRREDTFDDGATFLIGSSFQN